MCSLPSLSLSFPSLCPSLSNLKLWLLRISLRKYHRLTELLRNYLCALLGKVKLKKNSLLSSGLTSRQRDNDRKRIVNNFERNVFRETLLLFPSWGQNYYRLWHFYWVREWQRNENFFWLLFWSLREIKLSQSRWKKLLKDKLHSMFAYFLLSGTLATVRFGDGDDGEHNFISVMIPGYQLKIIYDSRWQQQIEIIHQAKTAWRNKCSINYRSWW